MFRNFAVVVASLAAAWSTATGSLDVRFSMAVVVAAGLFGVAEVSLLGSLGLAAPTFFLEARQINRSLMVISVLSSQ